jgi:hypothetical protein
VDVGVAKLFGEIRRSALVTSLDDTIQLSQKKRRRMLNAVIAASTEEESDYSAGMADTLPSYANEVIVIKSALATLPLTSAAGLALTNALARAKAAKVKANAAFGGGE